MRTSTERILTTHVGSLPRPHDVAELLAAKEFGEDYDTVAFEDRMDRAVADCVADQCAIGLDVINDGEIAKTGYATYIQDRLSGFSGSRGRRGRPSSRTGWQCKGGRFGRRRCA